MGEALTSRLDPRFLVREDAVSVIPGGALMVDLSEEVPSFSYAPGYIVGETSPPKSTSFWVFSEPEPRQGRPGHLDPLPWGLNELGWTRVDRRGPQGDIVVVFRAGREALLCVPKGAEDSAKGTGLEPFVVDPWPDLLGLPPRLMERAMVVAALNGREGPKVRREHLAFLQQVIRALVGDS